MTMADVLSFLEYAVWSFCAVAIGVTLARLAAMADESDRATRVCRWIVKRGSPSVTVNVHPGGVTTREQMSDGVGRAVDDVMKEPREWRNIPPAPPKPEPTKRKRGKR